MGLFMNLFSELLRIAALGSVAMVLGCGSSSSITAPALSETPQSVATVSSIKDPTPVSVVTTTPLAAPTQVSVITTTSIVEPTQVSVITTTPIVEPTQVSVITTTPIVEPTQVVVSDVATEAVPNSPYKPPVLTEEMISEFNAAKSRWQSAGVKNYQFSLGKFNGIPIWPVDPATGKIDYSKVFWPVLINVSNGEIGSAFAFTPQRPLTQEERTPLYSIDGLFSIIENQYLKLGQPIWVIYDVQYGYPRQIQFQQSSDPSGYTATAFVVN
jgi:Family of unknown function (DUF6174)